MCGIKILKPDYQRVEEEPKQKINSKDFAIEMWRTRKKFMYNMYAVIVALFITNMFNHYFKWAIVIGFIIYLVFIIAFNSNEMNRINLKYKLGFPLINVRQENPRNPGKNNFGGL